MKFSLLTTFSISCFVIGSHSPPVRPPLMNYKEGAAFLEEFGYLNEANGRGGMAGEFSGEDVVSNAIKGFQRFVGLKVTGKLDQDTVVKMNSPRCGVKDIIDPSKSARRKRYAHEGSRWRLRLTYRVSKYPVKIRDRSKVDEEMARAFKVWSDNTMVTFEERKTGRVNIDIRFESGEHPCKFRAFDGRGKNLAHAFYPQYGGNIHFDDDEEWTIGEGIGTDLFQVATHEFGHSLGLLHSEEQDAVMTPYYVEYNPSFKLHKDDIQAIQLLYGSTDVLSLPEDELKGPHSVPSDAPDLCQDAKIDTIIRTQNGTTYAFKGNFYWKVHSEGGIAEGFPRRISDDWDGLEGNLDASFTWSNRNYFFKEGRYWRFTGKKMDTGYPKLLSVGFKGINDNLDAAVVWNKNGKPYFFKGAQYWRYDSKANPPVKSTYPLLISRWEGVPNDTDAALRWDNNKTYFFKGDEYYRFDDTTFKVDKDPQYPRPTSVRWFGCK